MQQISTCGTLSFASDTLNSMTFSQNAMYPLGVAQQMPRSASAVPSLVAGLLALATMTAPGLAQQSPPRIRSIVNAASAQPGIGAGSIALLTGEDLASAACSAQ